MKDYSVLDGITRNMKDCLITAYNKGYSRGYEDGWAVHKEIRQKDMDMGYEQGLKDAWECAKKLVLSSEHGGMRSETINEVFGFSDFLEGGYDVFKNYTAEQAMQKIKDYEERQKLKKAYEEKFMPIGRANMEKKREERQTRYDIEKVYDPIEGEERYTFVPKKERQTERTCDTCFHNPVCYRKESVKYIADYAEKCGDYEQMRKESHDN